MVLDALRDVPAAWDDTVGLAGQPGDHVVIARRKGDAWWLAGINGRQARAGSRVNLGRLGTLRGRWRIVQDGDGRDEVVERTAPVHEGPARAQIDLPAMAAGGGFLARLEAS